MVWEQPVIYSLSQLGFTDYAVKLWYYVLSVQVNVHDGASIGRGGMKDPTIAPLDLSVKAATYMYGRAESNNCRAAVALVPFEF